MTGLPLFDHDDLPPDPIRAQRVEDAKRTARDMLLGIVVAILLVGFVAGVTTAMIVDALTTPDTPTCTTTHDWTPT